jgi:hypothetical protein
VKAKLNDPKSRSRRYFAMPQPQEEYSRFTRAFARSLRYALFPTASGVVVKAQACAASPHPSA